MIPGPSENRDSFSACRLEGKGEVTPNTVDVVLFSREIEPLESICRFRFRAKLELSLVMDSIIWLSRPEPRNIRGSVIALSAWKGDENL